MLCLKHKPNSMIVSLIAAKSKKLQRSACNSPIRFSTDEHARDMHKQTKVNILRLK